MALNRALEMTIGVSERRLLLRSVLDLFAQEFSQQSGTPHEGCSALLVVAVARLVAHD